MLNTKERVYMSDNKRYDKSKRNTPVSLVKSVRWLLVIYDFLAYSLISFGFFYVFNYYAPLDLPTYVWHSALIFLIILLCRFIFKIYVQIWRYGGIRSYVSLIASDFIASIVTIGLFFIISPHETLLFRIAVISTNLLASLTMRMIYRYAYKHIDPRTGFGKFVFAVIDFFAMHRVEPNVDSYSTDQKIKIAIVGAGRVGVSLAEELLNNSHSAYEPKLFIDFNKEIIGRNIYGIPVIAESEATAEELNEYGIREIVFALPKMDNENQERIYNYYAQTGCTIKIYDYPIIQNAAKGKRALREFGIEELLFRKPVDMLGNRTNDYYTGKTVLITGGGGSIGSELARQIAKMEPKKLVLLDVYENGVYDIQQELSILYGDQLDLSVEILSVTNREALERMFMTYDIDIVLHAAAHKHVPLMEHNVVEAVENNVFGTNNVVELSEKYGVEHFIMVSTDKAVNPTNVMGATKRMCEIIVGAHSNLNKTVFTATRFGNVLGSAGSVIPLFRKQIASGGPVTLTDKRIIRYFMTIPEASQLVLTSGALAKNGELFVLDMGKPVKILTLAENLIRLSGYTPYKEIDIVEIGLRPGEKLYEELLVKTEELKKTENELIFIEDDKKISIAELNEKLDVLRQALDSNDNAAVKKALRLCVSTYRDPEEVNKEAISIMKEQIGENAAEGI